MSLQTIDFAQFPLANGDRVLDLGCGEGRHSILAYLDAQVTVVALDLGHGDLITTKERFREFVDPQDSKRSLSPIQGSGLSLPFENATFDKIVCSEVLEHIPDYHAVLDEIRRVLKPNGKIAISVPRFFPEWVCWMLSNEYHETPGGHIRIFRSSELKRAVERLDFRLRKRHWAHSLHVPFWWLRCLFWRHGPDYGPVRAYHRLLVWDLMQAPLITRWLDRIANPLIGKSIVMYFDDQRATPK